MADSIQKSREEIIADWVADQHLAQKKRRKAGRLPKMEGGVTINSLMDAMFIVLVFLLMNYSVDPLRIDGSDDLKLPPSTTEINPKPSAAVTISAKGIVVNDQVVAKVKGGAVDKSLKQGDENGMQIQPLFEALNKQASKQKEMSARTGAKFDGMLTVIAHDETPYRLVTEVLFTASQAEFSKFKFAVLKGGQRGR